MHRPDGIIDFTLNFPPTFYNKIAPIKGSTTFMPTKQFQRVSTERLLVSYNWRWHLF